MKGDFVWCGASYTEGCACKIMLRPEAVKFEPIRRRQPLKMKPDTDRLCMINLDFREK